MRLVCVDLHEHDRPYDQPAVAGLGDLQRLVHVEIELDENHIAGDQDEWIPGIQVDLAIADQLGVDTLDDRAGRRINVIQDQVRELQADLAVGTRWHCVGHGKQLGKIPELEQVQCLGSRKKRHVARVANQAHGRDGGNGLVPFADRCIGHQHADGGRITGRGRSAAAAATATASGQCQ